MTMTVTAKRLGITPTELATLIGRHPSWVREQMREGNIPHVDLGSRTKLIPMWFIEQFDQPQPK